ncbi:MAG: PadR family transcriptional regulator [Thermomicrobia bacterium]|nr:PadR family transcriptional regulator [Thermomicrobia bacterium]MCA1724970.1 PadR family transcriptional regulator [Thermomicrobia bacterium]
MSAARLLILGVLQFKSPAHGYEIRRELESWHAEQWAHIAYGSIYFALNKMAEEGLVEAVSTDQVGKRPARTRYTLTEDGKGEFQRLLRDYWWDRKPLIDPFQVALSFMNSMPHDELLLALRYRADRIRAFLTAFQSRTMHAFSPDTPRHILENFRLAVAHEEVELHWIEEAIGKVERGELP